jgi:two-component system, NtrC family, nitrogen regulation response regulator NtrX
VIVATHRNLEQLVSAGTFRRDLFHRIVVFPIELPPLRSRTEDIPTLVEHFAQQVCTQNGWKPIPFTEDAVQALQHYEWPGNIRELRNVVERLMLLAGAEVDCDTVHMALPAGAAKENENGSGEAAKGTLAERVEAFEKSVVLSEIQNQHRNITRAAAALGLERSHLYKKCQQLGIDLRELPIGS